MPEERLEARQLREIIEVSGLITSTLDEREIRRRAVEAATRLIDAERASLLLIDGRAGNLHFDVALGEDPDRLNRVRLRPGEGIAGTVVKTCSPLIVNDVAADTRYRPDFDARTGFQTKSMICAPLTCKGTPLGVLEVINKRSGPFDQEDLAVASALANQIAIAVENSRLHRRLKRSFVEVSVYAAIFSVAFIGVGLWLVSLGR